MEDKQMNCTQHPNRDAVAQCNICGAGVCSECADATKALKDECGTLCPSCYKNKLTEAVEYSVKKNKKTMKRIIINSLSYVFGLIFAIFSITEIIAGKGDGVPMLIVSIIICGFYTGLTGHKIAKEQHEEYERTHGATYTITDSGVYKDNGFLSKLIFFLIGTVLGIIITPFSIIKNGLNYKSTKIAISELRNMIAKVSV